jgi:hypothetical protein
MLANPFTQISLPVTLADLLDAKAKALQLHGDARRLNDMAKAELDAVGTYLMPNSAQFHESMERAQAELDRSMWKRAFDLTGFKQLMDAEAVKDFERSLYPKPPEFNDGNIRATFIDLHQRSGQMFRRGIVNVFKYLSDDYKTNKKEAFKVGRKVVMTYMVSPAFKRGLQIRIGAGDKLDDIDRIIKTLDGKQFKPRSLEYAINAALEKSEPFEDANYRAKGFKNGNLHLEFKCQELLDGLNEQIAEHYSDGALPDAR